MTLVATGSDLPGIAGLFAGFPETARPMRALAESLLRGENSLSTGEREFLATLVSLRNGCRFCWMSHGAAAMAALNLSKETLIAHLEAPETLSPKIGCLAAIAEHVRKSVQVVPEDLVQQARKAGADDQAIHHTVLIAGAFSMYNRYVEGLGTPAPKSLDQYLTMGINLARDGYVRT